MKRPRLNKITCGRWPQSIQRLANQGLMPEVIMDFAGTIFGCFEQNQGTKCNALHKSYVISSELLNDISDVTKFVTVTPNHIPIRREYSHLPLWVFPQIIVTLVTSIYLYIYNKKIDVTKDVTIGVTERNLVTSFPSLANLSSGAPVSGIG